MRALALIAGLAILGAAGCASDGPSGPAYVVVEENVSISDRSLVRRISVLDDDQLIIEVGANDYYRATLLPGCIAFADMMAPVRLEETGIGIDRTSSFTIDGRRCSIRALDRVERRQRTVPAE